MAAPSQDGQPWQQLSMACWSCVLLGSYFLIKNLGSSIFLHLKQGSNPEFSGKSPDVVFFRENFGFFLYSLKNKGEKPLSPRIVALVRSILLSSAELLSAKWANLKDTFSPISFESPSSLEMLKNCR